MISIKNKPLHVLREEYERIEAELARRKLRVFVEKAWPLIEPDHAFVGNWHIDASCDALEAVTRGEIKDCIFNVPPGTMKSILVCVMHPAWEWTSMKPGAT